mgnify:CR=1 FL=1
MKVLKVIGKFIAGIILIGAIFLANNPTIQSHITNLINKII